MVMYAESIPQFSSNILNIGAVLLVVQLAFEIIGAEKSISFTPSTTVGMSGSCAGALKITCLAPALKCLPANSFVLNKPVDSITTSMFSLDQGNLTGFLSLHISIDLSSDIYKS